MLAVLARSPAERGGAFLIWFGFVFLFLLSLVCLIHEPETYTLACDFHIRKRHTFSARFFQTDKTKLLFYNANILFYSPRNISRHMA